MRPRLLMFLWLGLLALLSACSSATPATNVLPLAQGRPTLLLFFADN